MKLFEMWSLKAVDNINRGCHIVKPFRIFQRPSGASLPTVSTWRTAALPCTGSRYMEHLGNQSSVDGPLTCREVNRLTYRAFHGFGQAKFPDGGSVLGSSKFSILPQLPPRIQSNSKVVRQNELQNLSLLI